MTTVAMPLPILGGYPPDDSAGSAAAQLQMTVTSDATDPQARWPELLFDKDADEHWYWGFVMPSNYASDAVLRAYWTSNSTAGNVTFGSVLLAQTAGDAVSIRADNFAATDLNVAGDVSPGVAYYPLYCDIALTNADSVAAGDRVVLALYRDVSDSDDLAVGAIVLDCELRYTAG